MPGAGRVIMSLALGSGLEWGFPRCRGKGVAERRAKNRHKRSGGVLGFIGRLFRAGFILSLIAVAVAVGYGGAYVWKELKELPDVTALERYEPIEAIQIFDRNDRLVCTVEGDEDRRVVPLNQVSTQMQQAILAAEDRHFYEHHGINVLSICRECWLTCRLVTSSRAARP